MPPRKRDAARMLRFHHALWCVRVWVRGSPDEKLLVLGQHRLHELVDDVVGFLLDECGVGVQRLVVVPVQTRTVLHEVLPARPRLDDWHDNSSICWRRHCCRLGRERYGATTEDV